MDRIYETIQKHISTQPTEAGCLEWNGYCDKDGYGLKTFSIDGKYKTFRIHRLMFEKEKGNITQGQVIRHTCDNPRCANPNHLLIGSHQDNINDKISRNRASGGRMIGSKNPNHKLTEEQVKEIRNSNETNKSLAIKYNVSNVLIGLIKRNKIWVSNNEI